MEKPQPKSILIVNGEPDIADLYAEMLLMDVNNYIVTTTFTGKGCLSVIKKNKPDMILMDIELNDMDGWDLIEKIKRNNADMPVVVITSKIPRINDMVRLSHVSDYLMKPVTLDGLQMAVKDALEIPLLLDECEKKVKDHEVNQDFIYLLFISLRQNIANQKRFILMRQLYPDKKLKHDPDSKKHLYNLKEKINTAQSDIKNFKNSRFLLHSFAINKH